MTTIVCFGDSNTWGCPPYANIAQTPDRIPYERRWAQVMARALPAPAQIIEEGLSGRTTVFDDPIEGIHKNGARTLIPVIESHAPMDLLIIMLGTNDFKDQFSITAFNSARGMLTLIQMVKGHFALVERGPEILVVTPPSISEAAEPAIWGDGHRRCADHAYYLEQVASRTGCFHYDANKAVRVGIDGIHLDEPAHDLLGKALAREAEAILAMRNAS
ncbi:MAG TPA: GDSL-type esterase/lipase family protein [Devosia sp.]|nr:GDSL-type esterase/lipase family protein [Devosia sp.]